jgi:hypothetical protein
MSRKLSTTPLAPSDAFDLFVEKAKELASRRLIQDGFETGLVIRAGGAEGLSVEQPEPDEEDFRSFLLALRPFISKGEAIYIDRIYNLIETNVSDPALRAAARSSRETLKAAASGAEFKINDIDPAEIADLFIKGRLFHSDPASRATLDALSEDTEQLYLYFLMHPRQLSTDQAARNRARERSTRPSMSATSCTSVMRSRRRGRPRLSASAGASVMSSPPGCAGLAAAASPDAGGRR